MSQIASASKIHSRDTLSQYLRDNLGYEVTDVSYHPSQLSIPPKPCEVIQSMHLLSDYNKSFQTYLLETTSLSRTTIRSILEPFYRHHPAGDYLFIFTKDYSQLIFVSPLRILRPEKPMPTLQLRILPIEPSNLYHTDLEVLEGIALSPEEQQPEIIRNKHQEAFSVERVTDEFFDSYKLILGGLKEQLATQRCGTFDQIHAFAQQFLNRLMFLYFLQRKRWLKWADGDSDRRYMRSLWRKYKEKSQRGGFYATWLSPLFFYAFNKRTSLFPMELPGDIRASFLNMPFLNGGLFTEDEDLDKLGFDVPDETFSILLDQNIDGTRPGFLERYNFTIQESLPLEVEVAVDPEMLGKVYESLINEADRHQAGIFYTPRIEIDYMCRLSLIEYLYETTGLSKETLIPIVMAPASEDGRKELAGLADGEVNRLRGALDSVRVVDPAVGSGSFLVGMMNVIVQLYRAMAEQQGHHENEFALKKRIISQNLYGVDVKDWAVRVCELRLWLSLMIESEESQMDIYNQPLLPNLTFKARQGDSLVEEIAGVSLSLRADYAHIPPPLKQQIRTIVDKKTDYFRGDRSVNRHDIEYLEHELFRSVIDSRMKTITTEIRKLELPQEQAFQAGLEQIRGAMDMTGAMLKSMEEARAKVQPQIDKLRQEKERLQKVAANINKKGEKDYFLWDIDFAEVFLEKGGFDIVIGNPPYVKQQEIAPPLAKAEQYDSDEWRDIKKRYKEQLEGMVRAHWGKAVTKIDKRSDLYVYFYYQGLNLLRAGGFFCFINSNSWLDVGYGGSLQQFLLKSIKVCQIIDNHARRSFKASDVNTVIVLLQRPKDGSWESLKSNISKFIAYRVPFEAGANAENILLQEWSDSVQSVAEFRVYPIKQEELWLDGLEMPDEAEVASLDIGVEHGKYAGGKWGGKYLRAPDIFFTILEKGKGKLTRLADIAEVKTYFISGADDFFFVECLGMSEPSHRVTVVPSAEIDGARPRFEIETQHLTAAIRSMGTLSFPRLSNNEITTRLLIVKGTKRQLHGQSVLQYINFGEAHGLNTNAKCLRRSVWYEIEELTCAPILWVRRHGDRHMVVLNDINVKSGDFLRLYPQADSEVMCGLLTSTFVALAKELYGRVSLGGGALKTELMDISKLPVLVPKVFSPLQLLRLKKAFYHLSVRAVKPMLEELGLPKHNEDYSNIRLEDVSLDKVLPDRRELDKVVFEAIGLTEEEQLEVYQAVVTLVKNRLVKARSV